MDTPDALLEQLRTDRDAGPEGHLVLADALEESDPDLAALVRADCALEAAPDDAVAQRKADARRAAYLRKHIGELPKGVELGWRRGLVDTVTVASRTAEKDKVAILQAIVAGGPFRLLDQLTIGLQGRANTLARTLGAVSGTAPLRAIRLGQGLYEEPYRRVYDDFERLDADDDLTLVWERFPALAEVVVDPGLAQLRMGAPELPALRSFAWVSPYLDELAPVLRLKAPNLERLVVWTGQVKHVNWSNEGYEPELDQQRGHGLVGYAKLRKLFEHADGLPRLTTFGVANYAGDWAELAGHFQAHPVFQRIEVLDLTRGHLLDDDVAALIAARPHLPALKRLVLDDVHTTYARVEALRDAFHVDIDGVETFEPSQFYYVSAQE
ncbi:MAG: hypothetical protein R2724_35140 [Bryobacterales bacterium]